MKKLISLVLAAGLCLSIFAADIFTYAPIKGDVRAYKRTDFSIASRFGNYYRTPSVKFAHLLDENGNDVESTEISSKEEVVNTIKSEYDFNGKLISQVATDADGETIWTTEITYKNGLKSEMSEFNASHELRSKTIYSYSFDRLVDESSYDGNGALVWKVIYTYDGDDRLDTVSDYFPTGALSDQVKYEYDDNGVVKSVTHTDSISKVALKDVIRYNNAGIVTEIATYDEAQQVTKRVVFKYDSNGNIAQVSTYNVANKFGGIVNELVGMSDFSFKYSGDPSLEVNDEVIVVSEK